MSERKIVVLPRSPRAKPKLKVDVAEVAPNTPSESAKSAVQPAEHSVGLSKAGATKAAPVKCKAHLKNGKPCGRWPIKGGTVCPKHGGATPNVKRKAQERLAAASDWLIGELLRIAKSADSEPVRLAAIRDALDRAGLGAKQTLSVEVTKFEELTTRIVDERITVADDYAEVIDAEIVADTEKSQSASSDSLAVTDNLPTDGVGDAAVPDTANLSDRPPARVRGVRRARDPGVPWLR